MADGQRALRRAVPRLLSALTIVALGLAAVWPLFRQPALACTDDLAFHLLRLTQLDHLLSQGIIYSRWAPDMALGYGFPFYNFYAPLAYYLAAVVSALGVGLNLGMRLTFALGILGSGLATYRLARDHFSRPAAFVAATSVMYAPYHGYDVYFRGNLAEALAWPFLALALWAMGRLARGGGRIWLPVAALAAAAVLLTHNVFALIFLPLLALYGLSEAWFGSRATRPDEYWTTSAQWRRVASVAGALGLALGMSAFFWLPAMWEQRYVHIDRLLVPPVFVYWNNFITLRELLAAPRAILPDLLNPSPPRGLGLVAVLAALPALWGLWRWRDSRRRQVAFFGAAVLVYAFFTTAAAEPIWSAVPLLEFVQFPWRLLGPAAIALAMVIAAAVDAFAASKSEHAQIGRMLFAAAASVAIVLASLFWFEPRYCGGLEAPQVRHIISYEQATDTIGTTAKGEYLPRTVERYPPEPALAPGRFAASTLPAEVALIDQSDSPLRASANLEAAAPVQLTVNVFAYPGWRAWVDGDEVPITPEPEYGRVTVPLPAGQHEVTIRFGETPFRLAADLVSALSVLVLAMWFVRRGRQDSAAPPAAPGVSQPLFLVLGLVLFGLMALLPRLQSPLYHAGLREGQLAALQETRAISYPDGMQFLGFNREVRGLVAADSTFRYDLFWTVSQIPAANYQSTLQLAGPDGQLWSAKDTTRPRDFRSPPLTSAWHPDQFAQDSHLLAPLPGTPPGRYAIQLLLFDRASLQPLTALGYDGSALDLEQIELGRPARSATQDELQPQYPADVVWAPLRLLGYNLDRSMASPGDPFLLTLFWQADTAPEAAYTAELTLLSPQGTVVLTRRLPPVRADFPTTAWEQGDTWRGQHLLRLPPSLESGTHRWQLTLCRDEAGCSDYTPLELGTLAMTAPERLFDVPPVALPLSDRVGEIATLVGADVNPERLVPASSLDVSLVWRVDAETSTSYRVFLHLIDPNGMTISQSDQEPAGWTRPTTGWLEGEVIIDRHQLALPAELSAGTYRLVAGFYEPESGRRLLLPGGKDFAVITQFEVDR
jgi:hypothetical protein